MSLGLLLGSAVVGAALRPLWALAGAAAAFIAKSLL